MMTSPERTLQNELSRAQKAKHRHVFSLGFLALFAIVFLLTIRSYDLQGGGVGCSNNQVVLITHKSDNDNSNDNGRKATQNKESSPSLDSTLKLNDASVIEYLEHKGMTIAALELRHVLSGSTAAAADGKDGDATKQAAPAAVTPVEEIVSVERAQVVPEKDPSTATPTANPTAKPTTTPTATPTMAPAAIEKVSEDCLVKLTDPEMGLCGYLVKNFGDQLGMDLVRYVT